MSPRLLVARILCAIVAGAVLYYVVASVLYVVRFFS